MNEIFLKYSVIIPTFNEERGVLNCINSVKDSNPNAEIIVVDGGSTDQTRLIAKKTGARIFATPKCRGRQLNLGSEKATGDIFLFLHGDTVLPQKAFIFLEKHLEANPHFKAGKFRMKFDYRHPALNFSSWMTRYDSIWTSFGDQCIVVRKDFFLNLGTFPDLPLFEDVLFFQKARKLCKIECFPLEVTTSAARYLKNGVLRQQLKNGILILKYLFGASPRLLDNEYNS